MSATHVHRANKDSPEQDTKVEITPQRAEYVRDNKDASLSQLQEATDLGEWIIKEIILVKESNYMRGKGYRGRAGRPRRFGKMPQEMKDYLKNMDEEKLKYREFKEKFNEHWEESELTPIGEVTLHRYYKKLQSPANLSKQGEKSF